jgi:hypothetical protein
VKPCPTFWGAQTAIIDEQVWATVMKTGKDMEHVKRVLASKREQAQARLDALGGTHETIAAELADVEKHQTILRRRMATEGDDTIAAQNRVTLAELNARHAELEMRRMALSKGEDKFARVLRMFEETRVFLVEKARAEGIQMPLNLTRAEKRRIMHSLGIKVRLYRKDDPYTIEHNRRWELKFADAGEEETYSTATLPPST